MDQAMLLSVKHPEGICVSGSVIWSLLRQRSYRGCRNRTCPVILQVLDADNRKVCPL